MDKNEDFTMHNISEDLIDMYLNDCMKNAKMCTCRRCTADVRCFALNQFPAHYVVSSYGELMTRASALSIQFKTDILTSIMYGIKRVSENPRCGNPEAQR